MLLSFIIIMGIMVIAVGFAILAEFNQGTYNSTKKVGYIERKSLKDFQKDYPDKKVKDLKNEIEQVAIRFVDNQSSNRYTENLLNKASQDKIIQKLNKEFVDDVKILKYKDKKLLAKVDYNLDNAKYSLLFDMITVSTGRVFLKKYNIIRELNSKEKSF